MDNPAIQTTLGTRDKRETNKDKNNLKKMSYTDPTKKPRMISGSLEG
jgi:hypothetical protein